MIGSPDAGYRGFLDGRELGDPMLAQMFLVKQVLAGNNHCGVVEVMAVSPGGTGAVGTVDIQLLVNQVDGANNATPHGTIHSVPYFRLQGGGNAMILDPAVGDIGIAVFADRDISSVKATRRQANPGSQRRFDFADALYLGGILNGAPSQFVQFTGTGIVLKDMSGSEIIMSGGTIALNPADGIVTVAGQVVGAGKDGVGMSMTGSVLATGAVVAGAGTGDQISLQTHQHENGGGTGLSGTPAPGT